MSNTDGTFGRIGDRAERYPNGMFKYNRMNMSYPEMFERRRQEGDFFAVFQNDLGEVRVEYANLSDYDTFVFKQIEKSVQMQRRGLSAEDVYLLHGCVMISRIHDFDFEDFVHLLDYKLMQVFDMRKLIEWTNFNKAFFSSPAENAILEDATDQAGLIEAHDKMANTGEGA